MHQAHSRVIHVQLSNVDAPCHALVQLKVTRRHMFEQGASDCQVCNKTTYTAITLPVGQCKQLLIWLIRPTSSKGPMGTENPYRSTYPSPGRKKNFHSLVTGPSTFSDSMPPFRHFVCVKSNFFLPMSVNVSFIESPARTTVRRFL